MKIFSFVFCVFVFASAAFADDFEYNTGGSMDYVPESGGGTVGWGEWLITTVHNNTGHDLILNEFGFPCCGPATGAYGWIVWTDVGGYVAPSGDASTADYYGAFTPADPGYTVPPIVYTYINVSTESIIIPDGNYFCFGYDNTDVGGLTPYIDVLSWAWYGGAWDCDATWGFTSVHQVKANYYITALERSTWGSIKNTF